MSSNIRRIFINSYLAYKDDPGESLQDFTADIDETIIDPGDINVGIVSLNFTPEHPNIPPYEAQVDLEYSSVRKTLTLPTGLIYAGVATPGAGTTFIDALNNEFKSEFSTSYEPWDFDADSVRVRFTPDTGENVEFYYDTTTLSRRLGMTVNQGGVTFTNASPLTMTNQPILSRTQVIFLTTDLTSDSTTNGGSSHGILLTIPIFNAEYGSLINYSPSHDFGKLASPRSFTNLRVRLLDDLFQPISFTSNTNLLMSLYVSYGDNDEGFNGQLKAPQF